MANHDARTAEEFLKELSCIPGFEEMRKIEVSSRSYLGDYPLHVAATRGDGEAIRLLVRAGADINAVDSFGKTALHNAALQEHRSACELLISLGADATLKDADGDTASDFLEAS